MPNQVQNVSFNNPGYSYGIDEAELERRKKLSEALQAQSMQNSPTEVVNGWAVRKSPMEHYSKIIQAISGAKIQSDTRDEQKALAEKYQSDLMSTLSSSQAVRTGTPGSPSPADELGGGPAQPPQPANAQLANALLMRHPATQQLGLQGMQRDMQTQGFINAGMGTGGTPAQPATPQAQLSGALSGAQPVSGSQPPPVAPSTQPQGASQGMPNGFGGPAGGQPMAVWLQSDPTGKSYLEQLAKDHTAGQNPVINRGYGIGRMVDGKYVPDQASIDQALAMERGKTGITAPLEPPITLNASGGQQIQLSRPEYADYQRTSQLPARYGQSQIQTGQGGIPNLAQQTRPPAARPSQALGTPGLSQSQSDQINQERQKAGGKAVDEAFAKDYVQFTTGGAQDGAKQLGQLKDVVTALEKPEANLTGPMLGSTPDVVKKFTNPQSIAMRERVEEVVQRSLRAILGAQFTEKEGERLIARAYNPNLPEKENSIRVGRLFTQLDQAYKAKQDAAKFFERNGTLEGWKGKLPSMADFEPDANKASGKIGGDDPLGLRK